MYELIARLNREDGITILMVSHDLEAALQYASHILHIHKITAVFRNQRGVPEERHCAGFSGGERGEYPWESLNSCPAICRFLLSGMH